MLFMMGTMMGKKAKELSALEVGRIKAPGVHFVGGVAGLALQVSPSGARSWILRAMVGTKRRDMGLGGFPDVPLVTAKERARSARDQIAKGIDPVAEKRAKKSALIAAEGKSVTFKQAADLFIKAKEHEWSNTKHAAQWRATVDTYAVPVIGKVLVRDVELPHILEILEPIWTTKTETASRLRGRLENILDWAKGRGYRVGDNPAKWRGHLEHQLAKPSKVAKVKHHTALPYTELGNFMAELRKQQGMGARALELAILTATRSNEVRGARWSEIDWKAAVWTIPAERMKMKREHRIPLSADAVALLKALPQADHDLVFPGSKEGSTISDMTMPLVIRRMGVNAVPHGFRSTFRDWAAECTNYPREVAEMALAHSIGDKVEAAYRRGDLFDKRRRMMADWATFCGTASISADVVPIKGKRKAAVSA